MSFGTLAHAPREGQGASLLDDVEHQRQAATANDTALHDHDQRLEGSLRQQDLDIR